MGGGEITYLVGAEVLCPAEPIVSDHPEKLQLRKDLCDRTESSP